MWVGPKHADPLDCLASSQILIRTEHHHGCAKFFWDIASFKGDPFTLKSGANLCTKGSGESQLRCQAQKMAEVEGSWP